MITQEEIINNAWDIVMNEDETALARLDAAIYLIDFDEMTIEEYEVLWENIT